MDRYLARPAFSVDGTPYTWRDAWDAAAAWGDRDRQREETLRALALVAAAPPPEERVAAAAREFRYARDLVSGDDMRRWLDARELSASEWTEHVRRQVALASAAGAPAPAAAPAPEDADVGRAVLVDAVCGGLLDRAARRLAGRLALVAAMGEAGPGDGGPAVARADAAHARVRERLATPAALASQVSAHRLEWLAVQCRVATFASEAAAREALLCVREDGEPLAGVAAEARAPLESRSIRLEEAGPLQTPLMGSAPGELLGPLPLNGGHALVEVVAKRLPDLADPGTRERAERAVLDGATAAAAADRVRWV